MIGQLFRSPIEAVELRGGVEPDALLPAESAALGDVLDSRRRDFAAGRHCARRALARVGVAPEPILTGPHREPLWPDGVVGSITHCDGYAAAAVARAAEVAALGVDAEPHSPLPDGVLRLVAGEEERTWLESAPAGTCWDRVLFSAKESVFKAWSPLVGRWLGFREAVVSFAPDDGTFRADIVAPAAGSPSSFSGRFVVRDGLVLTAVVVPRT